jgi:hypothetical protein
MPVRHYRFRRPAGIKLLVALAGLATLTGVHAQQIVLNNTRGLDFGRFVAGTGGTISVTPAGVRSRTGGVVLLNSPGAGQAAFTVSRSSNGGNNKAVSITVPANGSIRLSSGANSMAVNNFVHTPTTILTVPTGGTTLSIGATLTVAPNQPPGTYSGSFPVTVNFQ